jgi:hypothetical protein
LEIGQLFRWLIRRLLKGILACRDVDEGMGETHKVREIHKKIIWMVTGGFRYNILLQELCRIHRNIHSALRGAEAAGRMPSVRHRRSGMIRVLLGRICISE